MSTSRAPLLVVEDNDEDFDVFVVTCRDAGLESPIHRCADGEEALEFLHHTGRYQDPDRAPRPGLIVLDLNLAGLDGRQVLERIKANPALRTIPVLILSTSDNPRDVHACYELGASAYLLKPVDLLRFERMVQLFKELWFEYTVLPGAPPRGVVRP